MFNNYLVLRKLCEELSSAIPGGQLIQAFTQEKEQIILTFSSLENLPPLYLSVSVNPLKPSIYSRDIYHRAKKNSVDFFTNYLPSELIKIEIADYERIIRLTFNSFRIFIVFRGPLSNVILMDENDNVVTFKTESENNSLKLKEALNSAVFSPALPAVTIPPGSNRESLQRIFPFFSKEIIKEIIYRDMPVTSHSVNALIEEILKESISIVKDNNRRDIHFLPSSFSYYKNDISSPEEIHLPSVNESIKYYLSNFSMMNSFSSLFKRLEKYILLNLEQLSDKLNRQQSRSTLSSREEEFNKLGNLLLINKDIISKGLSSVSLADIYNNNETIIIPLKSTLTPIENANYYFDKAKNEKIIISKSKKLQLVTKDKYDFFILMKQKLYESRKLEELIKIKKELGMDDNEYSTEENELTKKFRHFILGDKYHVYVGKDSAANDLLTIRFAKPNDLWFHARGYAGSHTILKVANTKEGVPKEIIKKAASIAAFYSKGKTSKLVPVSYTFKKYVSKRKGLEVGQVMLTREQVVMVKPEIPSEINDS